MFQSLSGFLIRCNRRRTGGPDDQIPSFNPYRVFLFAVTPQPPVATSAPLLWFQSLSGFLIRCNRYQECRCSSVLGFNPYRVFLFAVTLEKEKAVRIRELLCFNPYRVFLFAVTLLGHLQPWLQFRFNPYRVFLFAVTRIARSSRPTPSACFNPYRVFLFAVTQSNLPPSLHELKFQSLSGFLIRCNEGNKGQEIPMICHEFVRLLLQENFP